MLEALKRWASGWVASVLIGLLILSFALWGVADVFTGFSQRSLANVGERAISADEFQKAFQDEIAALSQQAGRRISIDQARAIGLDQQVLSRMINTAVVEVYADDLGLALSDDTLVEGLKQDPLFRGTDGKFSKRKLEGILRQSGVSESSLLILRRRDELRNQVVSALLRSVVVPEPFIDVLHNWRNETRTLEFVTVDAEKMIKLDDAGDDDLKKIYEDSKLKFRTEATRKLAVLVLSIDDLKKKVEVSEDRLKEVYKETKQTYDKPEERQVQQIAFPDKAAAAAAKKAIDGGKSFEDAAKDNGVSKEDIELGLLKKAAMIDKAIADATFSLNKDEVSDVVEGQFATVLLKVTEIKPGKESTFEEAKDKVRDVLATEIAQEKLQGIFTEVDDGRAAGTSLKEIAETTKLPFHDLQAVTLANKTLDGKKALDRNDGELIVSAGFDAEIGIEREPVELSDGGYAWVDVFAVSEPKQKSFEEVKDEVKKIWTERERRKQLSELGAKLVERLKNGEDIAKLAADVGGKVEKTEAVTRVKIPEGLTQAAMTQAFGMPKGGIGTAETAAGKSQLVFRVIDTGAAPSATEAQKAALTNELKQQLQQEVGSEYVEALKKRYGVSINQPLLDRLSGREDAQ